MQVILRVVKPPPAKYLVAVTPRPALWLALVLLFVPALGAQEMPMVTAYFSDRPPFAMVDGQTGILLGLAKSIFNEAGIRARFIDLPTARITELLRNGATNALAVGWYDGETQSLPFYQESPLVAVVHPRAASLLPPNPSLEAVLGAGMTLAVKAGAPLGRAMDEKIRAQGVSPLVTVGPVTTMLKLISQGRMDFTFLCEEEALYLIKTDSSLANLAVIRLSNPLEPNLRRFVYAAGFPPSVAAAIDAAIVKLTTEARLPAPPRSRKP